MRKLILLIFICVYFCSSAFAGRILALLPHTGKSHFIVYEPLLRQLAERGHHVTVVSFFPAKNPPANYTDVSLEEIAEIRVETVELSDLETDSLTSVLFRMLPLSIRRTVMQIKALSPLPDIVVNICEKLVHFQPLHRVLSEKYDLVLLQNFVGNCMMGLLHVYKVEAPIVTFISAPSCPWRHNLLGVNSNPSYVPGAITYFTNEMTFLQRVTNTLQLIYLNLWHEYFVEERERKVIEDFAKRKMPPLKELNKDFSLYLMNRFHELNGVRPLVPGVIEVGGIHLNKTQQKIPRFIEKFLNESEYGVIVMSFGSVLKTSSLPKHKEDMIKRALAQLPQRIIWKYEASADEGTLDGNILKVRWLPQYELLQHEKVVAFIGHGGMASATEAAAAGKPTLLVPFQYDQYHNAATAAAAGLARALPYDELGEAELLEAVREILTDEMRESARLMSLRWHDRQASPMDTAVFWVERTLRWGRASKLYAPALHLAPAQLALLDVFALLAALAAVPALLFVYIIKRIWKFLRFRSNKEKVH